MNALSFIHHPPRTRLAGEPRRSVPAAPIHRLGLLFLLTVLILSLGAGSSRAEGEAKQPAPPAPKASDARPAPAPGGKPADAVERLPRWAAYYYFFMSQLALRSGDTDNALQFLLLARKADPKAAAIDIEFAQFYARQGKAQAAVTYARNAVAKDPASKQARLLLAALLKATKKEQESTLEYEAALKQDPNDKDLLLRLGRLYFDQKQYDRAEAMFVRLSELKPADQTPFYYLGQISLARKDHAQAETRLKRALELSPGFEPAVEALAELYEKQRRFEDASRLLEKAVQGDAANTAFRLLLGRLYLIEKRKDEARALFEALKAEEEDPREVSIRIALVYLEQDEFAWAEAELRPVAEAEPGNDLVNFYLAVCYEHLKEQQKAVQGFLRVKPESDFFAESRVRAGYILNEAKDTEKAATLIKEAAALKPDTPLLHHALASLYEKNNRFDEAKKTIEAALVRLPGDTGLHYHLGAVLDKLKDKEGAIREMKRVLELDPSHAEAMNYLAYTWAEMGRNLNEALDLARKANQLQPDSGHILDTVGRIYFQQGSFPSALEYMQRAVQLLPEDPVVNEHLGDTYLKLQRYDKAFETYEKVLKLGPEDKARLEKKIEEARKKRR